jgi:hypothetical protein
LFVNPIVLGSGKKVFGSGTVPSNLTLAEPAVSSPTGTVLLYYSLAKGVPATGDMDEENRRPDPAEESALCTAETTPRHDTLDTCVHSGLATAVPHNVRNQCGRSERSMDRCAYHLRPGRRFRGVAITIAVDRAKGV